MRTKSLFILLFLLVPFSGWAQSPIVPSELDFGDIKLKINESGRKELQVLVNELTASPTYFDRKVQEAQLYFPVIERILEEENVPDDIKFLIIQESSFVPDAVSVSNAVGYWQFKDFTAAEMKLRIDSKIDERMNIVSSTHAAARYLKRNNFYFDNWVYAVQAYQMGAGAVMDRVSDDVKGKKTVTINKKTYWYVMKFLAHKIAYSYGLEKAPPSNQQFLEYSEGANKSLAQIANEFDIDPSDLESYNKWLKKGKIPADKQYTVVVPLRAGFQPEIAKGADKVENEMSATPVETDQYVNQVDEALFPIIKEKKKILSKAPEFTTVNGIKGVVAKSGESISFLASAGGLTESLFRKINEVLPHEEAIAGQVYYYQKKRRKAKVHYHTVQREDNLWGISQKYGVRMSRLLKKNRIQNKSDIKPGMILWMRYIRPAGEEIAYVAVDEGDKIVMDGPVEEDENLTTTSSHDFPPPGKRVIQHLVKQKESFYSIAQYYDVEVMDIVSWNDLDINQGLNMGQEIDLYVDLDFKPPEIDKEEGVGTMENEEIPANQEEEIFENYEVQVGDTLYGIARRYEVSVEDLKNWNSKNSTDVSIGEILRIKR